MSCGSGAVEAYSYDACDEVGLFLFDVAAAFPSVAHEWMWRALQAVHLQPSLSCVVRGLYTGAVVRIAWGGGGF